MIDFQQPNWFEQYLQYRQMHPLKVSNIRTITDDMHATLLQRFASLEHPAYAVLQQSGLIYGFPVHYPFENPGDWLEKMSDTARAKLILLDVMLYLGLSEQPNASTHDASIVEHYGQQIRKYYTALHRYAKDTDEEWIEQLIFERVRFKKSYFDFRKTGISSQLFWDLYGFMQYCQAVKMPDFQEDTFFATWLFNKRQLKNLTLQLIAAAARADHRISEKEKILHQQFERSAKLLAPEERAMLRDIFEQGVEIQDISIPPLDGIARRFLLDLCLLTIHVDAEVDALEEAFLVPLLNKLQLSPDELLHSKADLGCFLYLHGEQLHVFKGKKTGVLLLGQAIVENFVKLGNAARLEAVETRDMARTFGKLLNGKLRLGRTDNLPSEQEIRDAFNQLKDIPRFLPFFSMVFLPVPGITEAYILLAFSLEKLSGGSISLLPSQIRKVVQGDKHAKPKETDKNSR